MKPTMVRNLRAILQRAGLTTREFDTLHGVSRHWSASTKNGCGSGRMAEAGPVLRFDSGVGGLSVLRAIREKLPSHRFAYVADDAAFPTATGRRGRSRNISSR